MEQGIIQAAASTVLVAAFLVAAAVDIRFRRIPDGITAVVGVLALGRLTLALAGGDGSLFPVLADVAVAVLGFVLLALAFASGVMGGGDVKLMTASILWFGMQGAAAFVLITLVAGGVLSLIMLASGRHRSADTARSVPYGVAIAAGGIITLMRDLL